MPDYTSDGSAPGLVTVVNMTVSNTTDQPDLTVQCLSVFPRTKYYYPDMQEHVADIVLLALCIVLTVCTVVAYIYDAFGKNYRFKDDLKRQRVLVILGVYPMTIFLACLSLLVPSGLELADLVQSCYLSVCLYMFIELIFQYCGGKGHMTDILSEDKLRLRSGPCCCCCCCLPNVDVTMSSLRVIRGMVMQVAFIRPLLQFITVMLATDKPLLKKMDPESPQLYLTILTTASTLFAMYGLLILVRVTTEPLKKHRVRTKFLLLQLVLITTNLQTVIFQILGRFNLPHCRGVQGPKVRGEIINHMIIILEMFVLTLLARRAYRRSEHRGLSEYTVTVDSEETVTSPAQYGTVSPTLDRFTLEENGREPDSNSKKLLEVSTS